MGSPVRALGEHRLPQANQSIALVGANDRTWMCGLGLIKNCGAWPWMAALNHLSGIEKRVRRACERPSDTTRAAGQAQLGARLLNKNLNLCPWVVVRLGVFYVMARGNQ